MPETGSPVRPVRMRLSRRAGFNLQAESKALNGLYAVKVTRPGPWGNPFTVTDKLAAGATIRGSFTGDYIAVPTVEDAVACFTEMMTVDAEPGTRGRWLSENLSSLRGKNLACFCALDAPCHADVLLRLANQEPRHGL